MTRALLLLSLFLFFSFNLAAETSRPRPRPLPSLEDPCRGSYTGFYDGIGPIQFDFIRLNDDIIAARLHYQGVIYQGEGFCNARGESARVTITFKDAPRHEGRIERESDLLMFRGFQADDSIAFTAQKR